MRRPGLVALAMLVPGAARACAVCGAIGDPSADTFLWSTISLSLIPLGLFVGGFLYLRRAGRRWLGDEFREREEPGAGGGTATDRS
jgi:hypothetical protein